MREVWQHSGAAVIDQKLGDLLIGTSQRYPIRAFRHHRVDPTIDCPAANARPRRALLFDTGQRPADRIKLCNVQHAGLSQKKRRARSRATALGT